MLTETIRGDIAMRLADDHHAAPFFDFVERNRPFFRTWIPFVAGMTEPRAAAEKIRKYKSLFAEGSGYFYTLWDGPKVVGLALLMDIDRASSSAELGYMLDESYQGRGIASAACRRLLAFAFDTLGLNRIALCSDCRNAKSRALAERLGFSLEGTLRENIVIDGETCSTSVYGLLRADRRSEA